MALLFFDGFDGYATADLATRYNYTYNTPVVGSTYKRNGSQGLQLGYTDTVRKTVAPATTTQGLCGVAVYFDNSGAGQFLAVGNVEGDQLRLYLNADMTICLRDGNGSVLDNGSHAVSYDQWNYFEFKWTIANSGGTAQLRINGSSTDDINFVGDTHYRTTVSWSTVELFCGGTGTAMWFDDFYICDQTDASSGNTGPSNDDWLGDVYVTLKAPQTDAAGGGGSNNDFTLSTGTDHGAVVDDADADTDETDYAYSSTQNHVETHEYPALGVTGAVLGVQVSLCMKKTDTGTREIAAVARPSATNRVGDTQTLTTTYTYYTQVWDCSPETDDDWTVSEIDGSEFGVKVVT